MSTPLIVAPRLELAAPRRPDAPDTPGGTTGGGFTEALEKLVKDAQATADHANTAVAGMLDKSVDVHDAMIALQRAEMSLQLAVQVRNKLVQAYQDIMRMPV